MLHLGNRAEDLSVKRGVIPLHAFADLLGDRKITVKKIILDQATDDNVVFAPELVDNGQEHLPHGGVLLGHSGNLHASGPLRLFSCHLFQYLGLEIDITVRQCVMNDYQAGLT